MHTHRQETNRIGQQKLAELRDQLRFAATEAERRTLATQIVFLATPALRPPLKSRPQFSSTNLKLKSGY